MLCRGGRLPQWANQRVMRSANCSALGAPQRRSLHSDCKASQPHAVARQSREKTVPRQGFAPIDAYAFRPGWSVPRRQLATVDVRTTWLASGAVSMVRRSLVARNIRLFSTESRPPTAPAGEDSTSFSCSGTSFQPSCTNGKLATALRFIWYPFRLLLKLGAWCCLLVLAWSVFILVLWWILITVLVVWSWVERNFTTSDTATEAQPAKSASSRGPASAFTAANAARHDNDPVMITGAATAIAAVARSIGL